MDVPDDDNRPLSITVTVPRDSAVQARTASASVRCRGPLSRLDCDSASGDVRVGVRPGTTAWLDLATVSGRTRRELDDVTGEAAGGRCDVNLRVRTTSGDIHVFRADTG